MKNFEIKELTCTLILISLLAGLTTSCAGPTQYDQDEWSILANSKAEILTFKHKKLGFVMGNVRLNLKKDNKLCQLSGWEVIKDNGKLTITTNEPDSTTWEFKVTEKGLDISASVSNVVITGVAPATEDRIPARVENQDNGVMYTALGFVSARNIYNLFDRKTDILIQFPTTSDLSRNAFNEKALDLEIPIVKGTEISLIFDYYTEEIGLADYQKTAFKPTYEPIPDRFKTAPTGWCSWYCYYMSPTGEDIARETDAFARKLKPYGLEYVQLDACHTRGGDANYLQWNKEVFPRGGKWLFKYIRDKGLKPGLWVNAYGANYANPECADKYPENFFLRDKNGKLSSACCTADTTEVRLDCTNPEVIEKHLKPMFKTLVKDWGLEYLKDAGWGTWMDYYEKNRKNAFDASIDSREAYRRVQQVIREIMGPDNYITGCAMHEVGVGFGYFDGSRTGGDDYASWTGEGYWVDGMQVFFRSLFGANYLNGICWWSDPDVVMVRDPLTMEEGITIVSSIALTGQTYMISDFIADFSKERLQRFLSSKLSNDFARQYPDLVKALSEEKLELYKKTMPTMPITAMDLYPFRTKPICCPRPANYPEVLDLKVNAESGVYDVVAIYNWKDKPTTKTISFEEDLGLYPDKEYLIFDFWNLQLEGIFKDRIQTEVPAHGTRVLITRPLSNNPQLLATSRHITGAFSIKALRWNTTKLTLSGTSQAVPEASYSLFIYVPKGMKVSRVDANASGLSHNITQERVLEVNFTGQKEPVDWVVEFKK